MKKAGKKPILGIEFYACNQSATIQTPENRSTPHLPILAKNDQGWRQLVKLVSASNLKKHYYYKPRLSLEELSEFLDGSLIGFSGHLGSHMADAVLDNNNPRENWLELGIKKALYLQSIFGEGNFWLEVQLMDREHNPLQVTVADMIREISKQTGIACIGTPDAHYASKEQADDQRILLCANMKTTLKEASKPDFMLSGFFRSDNFHIPSYEEMVAYGHTQEELDNTVKIADQIEEYSEILKDPSIPVIFDQQFNSADEHLRHLCREGWKVLIKDIIPKDKQQEYVDRVNEELQILTEANLSGYFLICTDILNYARKKGWLPGIARGSAGGCLVSYLIGITGLDPVKYDLLFSRFFDSSRKNSMPDIDMDIPVEHRNEIIEYIKEKYGEENVCQMATFSTLKGRGALQAVFKAYDTISVEEGNKITKCIEEEAKIADELKDMDYPSSIIWTLENTKRLDEWCYYKDGNLDGPMAAEFAQAIRIEGCKSNQSKHASGIVISPKPLAECCPMILDTKSKKPIAGLEMGDLEAIGMVKFDILGLALLDKVMGVSSILQKGHIDEL